MTGETAGSVRGGLDEAALRRARLVGVVLVAVAACGFGSGPFFARAVYATGLDWLSLSAWRFIFGAAICWAWLLARPGGLASLRALPRRRVVVLLALGALFVGNSGTYFAALETVPASLAALIVYIYPVVVAVLSIRYARRLEGRRAWTALGMATLGGGLALGGIAPGALPPVSGLVLAFASPLIYAVWIVLAARAGGERAAREHAATETEVASTDPAPASAVMLTATAAIYVVAALATGRPVIPTDIAAAAWPGLLGVGAVSTALAIQGFYAGARRIGAARAALVSTVEPLYVITVATLLFGERLTPVQLVGAAFILAAVILVQTAPLAGRQAEARPSPAEA